MNSLIAKALSSSFVFLSSICLQLPINSPVYADKLYPVDEGAKNPSFNSFREQLRAAIKRRDTKFILSRLDPDIAVSLGPCGNGVKCFKELWQPEKPSSKLWNTLSEVIELGGAFDKLQGKKSFGAPYVFSNFPAQVEGEAIQGVFEYSVIIGKDVNVRSRPSLKSPIVANLSYDIVKIGFNANVSDDWVQIVTPTPGYVSSRFVRHPLDYRAGFENIKGRWVMTSFIAGD